MKTSVMENDMSTSQLCDCPAVLGNTVSTVVSVSDTETSESLKNAVTGHHTDSKLLEYNNAAEKAYSMSCKVQMCMEARATTGAVYVCVCVS